MRLVARRLLQVMGWRMPAALLVGVGCLAIAMSAKAWAAGRPLRVDPGSVARAKRAVAGELVVGFEKGVPEARRKEALKAASVSTLEVARGLRAYRVRVPAGADEQRTRARLAHTPGVAYVHPVHVVTAFASPGDGASSGTLTGAFTPNDSRYGMQWGLRRAQFDDAWDVATGTAVVIAVIDSGVDMSHPDLVGNLWTNPGETPGNGLDDDGNGYVDDIHGWNFVAGTSNPDDDYGHGTHVAGIAAAVTNNALGVAGGAWGGRIMALKMLNSSGTGTDYALARAIDYARANGASVINMSLGGPGQADVLDDACASAAAAGVVLVAAVGNDGDTSQGAVTNYPAGSPGVVAVAATSETSSAPVLEGDQRAEFSNYGTAGQYPRFVSAPGVGIQSTLPDHYTPLSAIAGYGYGALSGTSMATPHVAGLAAVLRSYASTWTATQVVERIKTTADPVGAYRFYGAGRINAYAAVGGASKYPAPSPADPREPDDTTATASTVLESVGSTTPALTYLFPAGDRDVFAIDTAVPGFLTLSVGPVVDLDMQIAYLGSAGTTQQVANSSTVMGRETLTVGLPGAGRYYAALADAYGGWGLRDYSASFTLVGDTVPPSVNMVSPAAGAFVASTVTVTANASDDLAVGSVEFRRDGEAAPLVVAGPTGPYTFLWDLSGAADGSAHTVEAQAVDTSGNRSSTVSRSVTIDRSPPVVYKFFASPATFSPNGDGLKDRTCIYYGTWDSVTKQVSVRVQVLSGSGATIRDFGSRPAGNGLHRLRWDGTDAGGRPLPAGRYTLRANARDAAGRWAPTAYAPLRIDRARPIVRSPRYDAARRRIAVRTYDISSPLSIEVRALTGSGSVAWRAIRTRVPSGESYFSAPRRAFAALAAGGRLRVLAIDAAGNRRVAYFRW